MTQQHQTNINEENYKFKLLAYNSLSCSKRMIKKGVPKKTAEAIAEEIAQGQQEYFDNFATKKCIQDSQKNLNQKIDRVNEDLNSKIDAVEERLNHKIDTVEERLNYKIDAVEERLNHKIDTVEERLENKIELSKKDIIFKIGSLMVASITISTAIISIVIKLSLS